VSSILLRAFCMNPMSKSFKVRLSSSGRIILNVSYISKTIYSSEISESYSSLSLVFIDYLISLL